MTRIGIDSWVVEADERIRQGRLERVVRRIERRVPLPGRVVAVAAVASLLPFVTSSDYVVRVGVNTLLFVLLAIGLNVVVGWAGLLDLGYVALYGFGGYVYAWLASDKLGVHLASPVAVVVVVCATAALGFLLGLPSQRLVGDYLAVVTLFFAQIFIVLTTNANRITLPWNDSPSDLTGGPNGISGVDPLSIGSFEVSSISGYYWVCLAAAALIATVAGLLNESRTGRGWRALREDPLAAELMGMPTRRLKLLAFVAGAAIAGLSGSLFAAVQQGVFPQNFGIPLLITIYAMVILGGAGSMTGVALGAIVINVVLELLRTPDHASWLFFGTIVVAIVAYMRPARRAALLLGTTVALGFAVFHVTRAVHPSWAEGQLDGGSLADVLEHWVVHSPAGTQLGQVAAAAVLALIVARAYVGPRVRPFLLPPLLYLAAVAWENVLVENPSVTRLILIGGLLIVLMQRRPQGLLGSARVEIV